jgi:hypothetical protein
MTSLSEERADEACEHSTKVILFLSQTEVSCHFSHYFLSSPIPLLFFLTSHIVSDVRRLTYLSQGQYSVVYIYAIERKSRCVLLNCNFWRCRPSFWHSDWNYLKAVSVVSVSALKSVTEISDYAFVICMSRLCNSVALLYCVFGRGLRSVPTYYCASNGLHTCVCLPRTLLHEVI